jgi:hypothetical protein
MVAMPRPKVFTVGLSDVDREKLAKLISTGTHPARMIMRARVLLDLDENLGRVDDQAVIADRVGVAVNTVRAVAKRFVETTAMSRPRSAASSARRRRCRRS